MAATVSEILSERRRAGEAPGLLVALVSVGVHAAFIVALTLVSRPRPRPFVPVSLPVRVVSPGLLARVAASRPAAPAPPARTEERKPRPVIEKIKPDEPARPSETAMPEPVKPKSRKPEPAPPVAQKGEAGNAAATGPAGLELPSAGGGAEGGAALSFGASVASFDADFPFSYYVEQLQALIGANWLKPNVPEGTACVVTFTILRTGQVTDVRVEATSGLGFFDRAATRSIYSANPLPPLPPEYPVDRLGVHVKFQ